MRRTILWGGAGALAAGAALLPMALPTRAADHIDSPAATADPAADITDVYAWTTTDASKLNLIMNVNFAAGANAAFSDAVAYVLHVTSQASYGAADKQETRVICKFYSRVGLECWAGGEYVTGNISSGNPLTSTSGKLKVFAGRRNDPFFFELTGFQKTVEKVVGTQGLTFDANGCPAVPPATSQLLVKQLQSSESIMAVTDNKPAKDTFAGLNVLSLAVQLDKTLVNSKGALLSVWGSTHRAQ